MVQGMCSLQPQLSLTEEDTRYHVYYWPQMSHLAASIRGEVRPLPPLGPPLLDTWRLLDAPSGGGEVATPNDDCAKLLYLLTCATERTADENTATLFQSLFPLKKAAHNALEQQRESEQ